MSRFKSILHKDLSGEGFNAGKSGRKQKRTINSKEDGLSYSRNECPIERPEITG